MASVSAAFAEAMMPTPMYQAYAQIAPRVEDWARLLDNMGQMLGKDYDWTQQVAALAMQTLIVVGDADSVRTSHAVEFFELLGGGKQDGGWDGSGMSNARLAILPGVTHYTIFSSPALAAAAISFLDAP
jgi:pimeloyl-ACP methyl ester carboxylesterase